MLRKYLTPKKLTMKNFAFTLLRGVALSMLLAVSSPVIFAQETAPKKIITVR